MSLPVESGQLRVSFTICFQRHKQWIFAWWVLNKGSNRTCVKKRFLFVESGGVVVLWLSLFCPPVFGQFCCFQILLITKMRIWLITPVAHTQWHIFALCISHKTFPSHQWVCHNPLLWHCWWKHSMGWLCPHHWCHLLLPHWKELSFLTVDCLLYNPDRSLFCIPVSASAATGRQHQFQPRKNKHCS